MTDSLLALLTPLGALAGVSLLILLMGRALRSTAWIRPAASGRLLIVKESIALDPRRRLHLVQHGDRCVLLLTGGDRDLVVGWLDKPP